MKRSFDFQPWLKPALTVLLGLLLIFRPGSITSSIAVCVGVVLALFGAGKLIGFFTQAGQKDFMKLAGAIVLLLIGFAIIRDPVSLEKQVVRVVGILLLLEGIRGYTDITVMRERVTSTALCVAGAVLTLMPVTVARLVIVICGIVVLLIGVGMIVGLLRGDGRDSGCTGGDGEIIDAR